MIRVLLADDHQLVRQALRTLLERDPGIDVVGEADDGYQALDAVRRLKPDVAILDVAMPRMDGIQACERILRLPDSIRVVILSMHKDPVIVGKALRSGALGYVLKTSVSDELLLAVRAAVDGQRFLSSKLDQELRETGLELGDVDAGEDVFGGLTPREREVLQLVAEGLTSRQIAETLHVSEKTIEKHRSHLMGKLGVHDVVGLVREAIRRKLVLFPE